MSASLALTTFAILFGMALPVLIIAYIWSRRTRYPSIKSILFTSVVGWSLLLVLIYGALAVAAGTCTGNALYGYHNCTVIPQDIANLSLRTYIVTTGLGLLYAVAAFTFCGVLAYLDRK